MGKGELQTLTAAEWVGGIEAPQAQALMCAFYLNELLIRLLPRDDAHPQLYDAYLQTLIELTELEPNEHEDCLRRFEWRLLRESGYAPDLQADCDGEAIAPHGHYRWLPEAGFKRLDTHLTGNYGMRQDQAAMSQVVHQTMAQYGANPADGSKLSKAVPSDETRQHSEGLLNDQASHHSDGMQPGDALLVGADCVEGDTLRSLAQGVFGHGIHRQQAKRLTRLILGHCLEGRTLYTRKMLFELESMTRSLTAGEV
jgi:hypothetical protein